MAFFVKSPLSCFTRFSAFLAVISFGACAYAGAGTAPLPAPAYTAKPWAALSPTQKSVLAPLAPEWNQFGDAQKSKWLEIAQTYSSMKPDEQTRIQERMRSWVSLSPEQRRAARENFALTTTVKPEVKSAKWQEYQQLSDEEKKRLAEIAAKKPRVANLPTPTQRPTAPLQPLKIGPKPAATPGNIPPPAKQIPDSAPSSATGNAGSATAASSPAIP